MARSWYGQLAEVPATSGELTVLAQAIDPLDQPDLLWGLFFPQRPVESITLSHMELPAVVRYVSDRREWNAKGRYIPYDVPSMEQMEMVPIESWFKLGELEMQRLRERFSGNANAALAAMQNQLPDRVRQLALANLRRIEMDAFKAWSTGTIIARNSVTGTAETFSFGFDAGRYQTAGVAWTGGSSGTAYANLLAWVQDAIDAGISVSGVMLRTSTLEAVRASAPNPFYGFQSNASVPATLTQVEQLIQDYLGTQFKFYRNERTVDAFATGAPTVTNTKLWAAQTIAIVPQGDAVGYTAFAPVARAFDLAAQLPEAKIDVNGQGVFLEESNNGKDLTVECQVNAMPIPVETQMWVINAGI